MSDSTKKRKGEFSSESQTEAKAAFDPATIPPSHHKTQEMRPVVVNAPGAVVGDAKPKPAGAATDAPDVDDDDAVRLPGGLPSNRLQVVETDAQLARAFAEQLEAGVKPKEPGSSGNVDLPASGGSGRDFPTGPRLGNAADLPRLEGEIVDEDSAESEGRSSWEADTAPEPALARGAASRRGGASGAASAPEEPTPSPAAPVAASRDVASSPPAAGHPHPIARAITLLALLGIVVLGVIALWPDPDPPGETANADGEGTPTGTEATATGIEAAPTATTTAAAVPSAEPTASAASTATAEASATAASATPPSTAPAATGAKPPSTAKTAAPVPTPKSSKPEIF